MRLKWLGSVALLGLVLLLDPGFTPAQFGRRDGGSGGGFPPSGGGGFPPSGGGFQPGGGFRMDPERIWTSLQQKTGSTGDTIDLGKLPPDARMMNKMISDKYGVPPWPESGILTKAQYLDYNARIESARAARSSGGGPTPFGGAPGTPPGGAPMVITLGSGSPGGPPPGGPTPFGGPPPGFGGGEDRGLQRLKEQDRDGDGRVAFAEADGKLRENFQRIDRNGDGYVDLDEYRGYYASRDSGRGSGDSNGGNPWGGGSPWGGNPWGGSDRGRDDNRKDTEEAKPVALRYGKLPKDLPEWYDSCDADKDGQVALHEWRKAGKDMAEFQTMDLNGDGLITADELLRFNRNNADNAKIAALNEGIRPAPAVAGGDRGSRGGGSRAPDAGSSDKPVSTEKPSSDRGSSDKSSDKGSSDKPDKSKFNPFQMGGKKK